MYNLDQYGRRIAPATMPKLKSIKTELDHDPTFGTAVLLRMIHDKSRARIESGEYNLQDVADAVKIGINFYTGESLEKSNKFV